MTDIDKWKGRQFYPKDTVTRKQMDRQDDRQTRRIDLYKEKHLRLQARVERLEQQISEIGVLLRREVSLEEKQS